MDVAILHLLSCVLGFSFFSLSLLMQKTDPKEKTIRPEKLNEK
jgi:hypothetical protein